LPPPRIDPHQEPIIATSEHMKCILADIGKVASSSTSVHLRGETGVGKEVLAQLIHRMSPRKDAPFIAVNCAAQTETLLESDLFGHERGAYSGAINKRIGLIERAEGGTLFLDEIGEISPRFQMLLLRVLQEREFERVGGGQRMRANIRLITATNRNLEEAVAQEAFRMDLYYRICVFTVLIPPLRERREDIPPLVELAVRRSACGPVEFRISDAVMDMFHSCQWPGNIRELINCVERSMVLAQGEIVEPRHIACFNGRCLSKELWGQRGATKVFADASDDAEKRTTEIQSWSLGERERLVDALRTANGIKSRAARQLGLTPRQVGYAMRKHGISRCKL